MSMGNLKFLNLIFLSVLLLISASIALLHTDTPQEEDPFCPGCVFQSTSIATAATGSFELPDLVLQGVCHSAESIGHSAPDLVLCSARSPPAA